MKKDKTETGKTIVTIGVLSAVVILQSYVVVNAQLRLRQTAYLLGEELGKLIWKK